MNKTENKEMVDAIKAAVQEHVNGKIDALRKEVKEAREENKEHMNEVQPFLDGWRGAKIISKAIKYIAGFIIAIGAASLVFMNWFK